MVSRLLGTITYYGNYRHYRHPKKLNDKIKDHKAILISGFVKIWIGKI